KTRRFVETKSEWGIPKFISKKIMSNPSSGYLVDDKCVFGAEVYVVKREAVTECVSLKNVDINHKQEFKISAQDYWFTAYEYSWGTHTFIELETINDPEKGFSVKDSCLLAYTNPRPSCCTSISLTYKKTRIKRTISS
ncbi:hypothetical protein MIMGU_mgv1a020549mg, partial [Erythranthe guttata]